MNLAKATPATSSQSLRPAMLTFEEAQHRLLGAVQAIPGQECLQTMDAMGRVLADDLFSTINVPPMDNTQMDGYALRAQDIGMDPLPVSQRVPAGHVGEALVPRTVARVFTGAMIPPGADTVVMQEQVEVLSQAQGQTPMRVLIKHSAQPGEWIRRAGEDIRCGAMVLGAGTLLSPQALGLAASVGVAKVMVKPLVRVACFFTGDELAMPGEVLRPGAIYNSNRFVLINALRALGCEVRDLGIVPDTLEATRAALREAAHGSDLIVTSGGVSVGEEDHVKPAVQAEGELDLWQIAMKPGKPLAFGRVKGAHFIGLPGNPVSSFVTFLLFVRPFLRMLQGMSAEQATLALRTLPMRADFDWPKADKRREFLRVAINAQGGLDLYQNQGSGVLTSTVWADGLVDNPPLQTIAKGDQVRFIPLASLQS
jgi:molybdopterin molybdotransferase